MPRRALQRVSCMILRAQLKLIEMLSLLLRELMDGSNTPKAATTILVQVFRGENGVRSDIIFAT